MEILQTVYIEALYNEGYNKNGDELVVGGQRMSVAIEIVKFFDVVAVVDELVAVVDGLVVVENVLEVCEVEQSFADELERFSADELV